jgi:hypothetical protein
MKKILYVIILAASICLSRAETYGYLTMDQEVLLAAGDVLQVLSARESNSNGLTLNLTLPDNTEISFFRTSLGFTSRTDGSAGSHVIVPGASIDQSKLVGPCKVTSKCFYMSYKISRASEIQYKQINIVSLPSDVVGAGTHNIVVEASDDLQTWIPVHSSPIGGNKAFFRTRITTIAP